MANESCGAPGGYIPSIACESGHQRYNPEFHFGCNCLIIMQVCCESGTGGTPSLQGEFLPCYTVECQSAVIQSSFMACATASSTASTWSRDDMGEKQFDLGYPCNVPADRCPPRRLNLNKPAPDDVLSIFAYSLGTPRLYGRRHQNTNNYNTHCRLLSTRGLV